MQYQKLWNAANRYGLVHLDRLRELYSDREQQTMRDQETIRLVLPKVYAVLGAPPSWKQTLSAANLWLPDSAASHRSAAALLGLLPLPTGKLDVLTSKRVLKASDLRIHVTTEPFRTVDREAIQSLPAASVLVQLAATVSDRALEQALEEALSQRLLTLAELATEADDRERKGRKGVARVSRLLDKYGAHDDRAGSTLERRALRAIRQAGLPEPRKQFSVRASGTQRYLDLSYPELQLAIEVDGRGVHARMTAFALDRARQDEVTIEGWTMLHVTHANFNSDIERVVRLYRSLTETSRSA